MIKIKSLIIILFFLSSNLFANRFFVDPVNGSESGNGTFSSPWKTLKNVIARNLIESRTYKLPYDANNPQLKTKNPGAPIKAGDTIMLYSGLHGEIELVNYINDDYITIMNVEG
ncbi:MAG TPA: hypothetical protein ENK91_15475, partial [Bacteroidetes bacterium]|nr:hypothetical protein [Bacteroidota bacterium]